MDRRRQLELQIRAVVVSLRAERRRGDVRVLDQFRDRARAILDSVADEANRDATLATKLRTARRELERLSPSPGGRFGQQTVDRGKKFLDREGLR